MPTDLRSQLAAAFGAATRTQTTEYFALNNTAARLNDLVDNSGEELNVFNNALAGRGNTPSEFEASDWGGVPSWKRRGPSALYCNVKEA